MKRPKNEMTRDEALKAGLISTEHRAATFAPNSMTRGKPPKYRNIRCEVDGIKFDSKLEAKHYRILRAAQDNGELWFMRQVPFRFPGGIVYRADFFVFYPPAMVAGLAIHECKGFWTEAAKIKRKLLEEHYCKPFGIRFVEITK